MSAIVLGMYTLVYVTPTQAALQTQEQTPEQTQEIRHVLPLSGLPFQKSNTEIKGSLLIIGGALRSDNDVVWKKFIQQAGGKGARIAIIPTASANPMRTGNAVAATLKRHGAQAFVLPVSVSEQQHSYLDVVKDPKVIDSLSKVTGVYFTGGDQGRITQALVQKMVRKLLCWRKFGRFTGVAG